MSNGTSSRVSWNWAAAIFGLFWMLYRKLYIPFTIFVIVILIDSFGGIALEEAGVLSTASVTAWDRLSVWVYSAVIGCWGNYWYYNKFCRINDAANQLFEEPVDQDLYLAQNGGTDSLGPFILAMVIGASLMWAYT